MNLCNHALRDFVCIASLPLAIGYKKNWQWGKFIWNAIAQKDEDDI